MHEVYLCMHQRVQWNLQHGTGVCQATCLLSASTFVIMLSYIGWLMAQNLQDSISHEWRTLHCWPICGEDTTTETPVQSARGIFLPIYMILYHADCHGNLHAVVHWQQLCCWSPPLLCLLSLQKQIRKVEAEIPRAALLCGNCFYSHHFWPHDHSQPHQRGHRLCVATSEWQHLGCGAGEAQRWSWVSAFPYHKAFVYNLLRLLCICSITTECHEELHKRTMTYDGVQSQGNSSASRCIFYPQAADELCKAWNSQRDLCRHRHCRDGCATCLLRSWLIWRMQGWGHGHPRTLPVGCHRRWDGWISGLSDSWGSGRVIIEAKRIWHLQIEKNLHPETTHSFEW